MEQLMPNLEPNLRLTAVGHPWRRYFARMADLSLYGVLWCAVQYLLLRWWPPNEFFYSLLTQYCMYALMFLFEPLLLCTWGSTPGKFIMGLRPGNVSGDKLTYPEALKRTFMVFGKGMGYGIPIYNLVRMYKCRKATLDNELLEWEDGSSYVMKEMRVIRGWGIAALQGGCMALVTIVILAASLPLHRDELTPAQYYANCNELLRRGRGTMNDFYEFDETGQIKEVVSTNSISLFTQSPPRHELTVENGFVTKVRLEMSGDIFAVWEMQNAVQIAYHSFVGAQRDARAGRLDRNAIGYANALNSPFEYLDYGVHVRNEVTKISEDETEIVFTLEKK